MAVFTLAKVVVVTDTNIAVKVMEDVSVLVVVVVNYSASYISGMVIKNEGSE